MSGCLELDEALPALTSRLLLLLDEEDDVLVLKPQSLPTTSLLARPLEESKEPEELLSPMLVSPCNNNHRRKHSSPLWYSPRFDTIPECGLPCGLPSIPSCPTPATPLSTKGLFACFPSSPLPQDLWQYGEANDQHPSFLSPRSTDAVWCKGNSNNKASSAAIAVAGTTTTTIPPMAPSLLPVVDDIPSSSSHSDSPPSIIRCRTRSSSSSSFSGFDFDDDEVSLLADDPDEDDADVLPPATYDVVVNILDEIDRDEECCGLPIHE